MNWPFVTRTKFEQERKHLKLLQAMLKDYKDELQEQRHEAIGLLATSQDRVDELVKTIVNMKRDGFEPVPETIELAPDKELPEEIMQAINEVSTKGTRDHFTNMAHAWEAIDAGDSYANIIQQITYGQEVDV